MVAENGGKPASIKDLNPKMVLTGVVKRVELFGAFVDVGVGRDGILHISQLSHSPVRNVSDVVKAGDEISVWVRNVDVEKNRIELTLIEPSDVEWSEIKPGGVISGTVTRVERFGAFVNIGAERDGRIHISELANDYVKDPKDVVNVGDEVTVRVLNVDKGKRQIDLSIKALEEQVVIVEDAEEEQEAVPTAMELAFRRAMAGDAVDEASAHRAKQKRQHSSRQKQEDILSRTLQQRGG